MVNINEFFSPERLNDLWKNTPQKNLEAAPEKTPGEIAFLLFEKFEQRALNDSGNNQGMAIMLTQTKDLMKKQLSGGSAPEEIKKVQEELAPLLDQLESLLDAFLLTPKPMKTL